MKHPPTEVLKSMAQLYYGDIEKSGGVKNELSLWWSQRRRFDCQ